MDKEYTQTPLVRSVRARLVRELRNGSYRPDCPLPTHRVWAKRFGVSTITVFRAMDALKAEGFIDSSKGASTLLRAVPPPDILRHNDPQAAKLIRLTTWNWDRKDLRKISFAIARQRFQALFRQEHPDIEFHEKQVELPSDEFQAVLVQSVLNGPEPTFAYTTQTCLPFLMEHGAIMPFADCTRLPQKPSGQKLRGADKTRDELNAKLQDALADLKPRYLQACRRNQGSRVGGQNSEDGALLMFPTHVSYLFLFYNKLLFSKAGLDPRQAPQDWEEFCVYGRKLSLAHGGIPSFHVAGSGNLIWWLEQLAYQSTGNLTNQTLPGINWLNKESGSAVEWFIDFYFKKRLLRFHRGGFSNLLPSCLANEIPMMIGDEGLAAQVAQLGEAERFGIALMPVGPNGKAMSQINCGGFFINAHAAPHEQKAALQYLMAWKQWVHRGEGGRQLKELGIVPPMFSSMREPAQDQFLVTDIPPDWKSSLAWIEAHGFWEPAGADWTRSVMGDTLANCLSQSDPPTSQRIQQALRLSEYETIIFKEGSNSDLKTKAQSLRMRDLESAVQHRERMR